MIFNLLFLTLLLFSSTTSALLEDLFQRESTCYSGCQSKYADKTSHADVCKKGCDYKLHHEKCADQCSAVSTDSQLRASCLDGCALVDSVNSQEGDRPRSIILIRLRQRPGLQLPSFNHDPAEFFRDLIQQMGGAAPSGEFKTIIHLAKSVPLIRLPADGVRADSSSESDEEQKMNSKHVVLFRQEHHPSANGRLQQFLGGVRREWNDLVHRQPNVPIWALLLLLLSLSALLWYMIVSLCSHAPNHRTLSIRAQELALDNAYEKEKLQPMDYHFVETLPINVKLTKA